MAKKSRKPNLPQETLERARRELYNTEAAPAASQEKARSEAPPALRKRKPVVVVDLREQYAYVLHDLQNMGILAAGLMAILVVLSFFL